MDGHGVYVWMTYGLALLIFGYNSFWPMMAKQSWLKREKQRIRREEASESKKSCSSKCSHGSKTTDAKKAADTKPAKKTMEKQ